MAAYLGADVFHASGVVSVVVAGIVVARYGSATGRLKGTQLLGFWNVLAFVLNGILFLLVGIAVPTTRLIAIGGLALGAYLIMFAARALPVYALLGLADIRGSSIHLELAAHDRLGVAFAAPCPWPSPCRSRQTRT